MEAFLNKERKKKKPFPWKVDLEIGTKVKIPVAGYIHVRFFFTVKVYSSDNEVDKVS
jgi:hypothetical protein